MEREVVEGTSLDSQEFIGLCEQLVSIVQESHEWAVIACFGVFGTHRSPVP